VFGQRHDNKYIPAAVWASSNKILKLYCSALMATDGSVYIKKDRHGGAAMAEFCSTSKRLAEDFQKAMLRLGVPMSIRSKVPNYTYKGESLKGKTAYIVEAGGEQKMLAFKKALNLYDYKRDNLEDGLARVAMRNGRKYKELDDNIYWDRIVSIEPIGKGVYWTLTQPNSSNYVGNGMISAQSGKDSSSTVACAYIVYQLLCLKNPQEYFGKPSGDYIDIMNIAINAQQANNVFFKGLRARVRNSPWFEGKFTERGSEIEFDKHIRIISGHSESESLEGYNVIVVVLDEIDGFVTEGTGSTTKKTAESIYKMHRASVDSRFGSQGKIISLSFPRTKEGFIMKHYNNLIAEKVVEQMEYTFKLDPDLPDGTEGNELVVQWTHDHVTRYVRPGIYVQRRPTWEVNPTKHIDDFALSFFADMNDSLGRFAAEPVDAVEGFFKDHDKITTAFRTRNGVDNETGEFYDWFRPQPDKKYFLAVDLAKKHDRAAVAVAHVEKWVRQRIAGKIYSAQPHVVVDAVRWWTPRPNKDVDFKDVSDFIVAVHQRKFNIGLVTFDRWRSDDMIKYLNSIGIKAGLLSVLKPQYQDLSMVMHEERLEGPGE